MEYGNDDYLDLLDFLNSTEQSPEGYESEPVFLCDKKRVVHFGGQIIPAFYFTNFILSMMGNGLVLYIIYKYEKLCTVTNIFLLNLVIADLLFACSLPFNAIYHNSEWIFGRFLCKVVGSLFSVGFHSSILFLTLMTFDRYLAVVHAVSAARNRRSLYAVASSVSVWAVSLLSGIKDIVLHDVRDDPQYGLLCENFGYSQKTLNKWKLFSYYQQFLMFFVLPLALVLYCYTRITIRIMYTRMKQKCRAVKLIFVIVLTFFICWTPYNIVIVLQAMEVSVTHRCPSDALDYAQFITRNLAFLYCCISPVFYTFLGKKFQNHFRKMLATYIPCLKVTLLVSQSSRTTSFKTPDT
ncbi:chemokine (C-C motif) receptor 12a [Denticeps clupeoides]|uniref:G-protein coupled receptors family 1 profile domain-containing protein n=1 Tax=Denticeps clupeoides TaxID=299321 RepID=A0AAY4AM86_9TELE|nr:C-C chemokine receptor type 3-like [Denticeps clupeoides]